MNIQMETFCRDTLKEGLAKCTEKQHHIFKLMYSHKNPEANINDVVDAMSTDKLDWAMQQVQRTLDTNNA